MNDTTLTAMDGTPATPKQRQVDWFRVYVVDHYTKDELKMTDDSFDYFVDAITEFLDDLFETYKDLYRKFLVYYDGRQRCRVGQALLIHAEEHPEWHVRIIRPPYHRHRGFAKNYAQYITKTLLPNAVLVVRDDRFKKSEVEAYVTSVVQHKIANADTCFRLQILLPQLQSQSFQL